jgi:hypothetical protein
VKFGLVTRVGSTGIVQDIARRKQAEAARRDRSIRAQAISETPVDAIIPF